MALPIKRLSAKVRGEIDRANTFRVAEGFPPVLVRVFDCPDCNGRFEAVADQRTCGCKSSKFEAAIRVARFAESEWVH